MDNLTKLSGSVLQPLVPILIALLVYLLGRATYFRQKEYELVVRRYLDECLDEISMQADAALGTFRYNWWQSTVVLKHFRDLGADMRRSLYEDVFLSHPPSQYQVHKFYRLKDLTGDDIFHVAQQYLDSFTRGAYAFFQDDLTAMIRVSIEGGRELEIDATRDELIETYFEQIKKLDEEAKRFYVYLGELENLAGIVQTERFSFKGIRSLQSRQEIIGIVRRMNEAFYPEHTSNDDAEQGESAA